MNLIDEESLQMTRIGMDNFTRQHLENWLIQHIWDGEIDRVRRMILDLIESDPELLDDHGWRELFDMADTAEVEKMNTGRR